MSDNAKRVKIPHLPLSGGCQCGAVRYRLTDMPLVFYLCHCTECQRHTSSAFGESLRFSAGAMEVDGRLRCTRRESSSGRPREGWFCAECGVRIWHGSEGLPEFNIKAGTLDDTSWLVPAGHIWTRSAQPFMTFRDDDLVYEQQPDDGYAALRSRWLAMTGQ